MKNLENPKFIIDENTCRNCGLCYTTFSCPAIQVIDGKPKIEVDYCLGCSVCYQICPFNAIKPNQSMDKVYEWLNTWRSLL